MKRLLLGLALVSVALLPQIASAQTPASTPTATPTYVGNNPTPSGLYIEGAIGVNLTDEIDFDLDGVDNDLTAEPNAGVLIAGAAGYNLPLGTMNFRMEGELAARLNSVDEIDDNLGNVAELDDADVSSIAGMANAYLDVYVVRNFALTVGAGLGYTRVTADLALIDDSASGFAFQGRAGARYNLGPNSVISLGYTYFAAPGLELDVEVDDEDINSEFDYTNHGFHLGYAFNF